jgi:hypothetical protein
MARSAVAAQSHKHRFEKQAERHDPAASDEEDSLSDSEARGLAPDERSPKRTGGTDDGTLTGDGAVDDGSVREHVEQTRLGPDGNPGKPAVPFTEQYPQFVAQLREVAEARL